jgi:ribosome-binding protein aMBF1 (putative translation factor)
MKKRGKERGRKAAAAGAAKRKHRPARRDKAWLRLRKVPKEWTEPLVERFRDAILARIEDMDVSNFRLADYSGVSPSMVGYVVKGTCLPGLEVAGRFCYVDNTSLAQILWDVLCDFRAGKSPPGSAGAHSAGGVQE